jgi:glycosyltransferase involved in cell wall biosynthesis
MTVGRGRLTRHSHDQGSLVLYTAVLPAYRIECIRMLAADLGPRFTAYAGEEHLDPTVRTALPSSLYTRVRNVALVRGRVLLQVGHWTTVLRADTAILDLNPRSISAWGLLFARQFLRRRTLVWGHLHPQNGASSRTARLRRAMRRLSDGTILYSYRDQPLAEAEMPGSPTWVAPNALYRRESIRVDPNPDRKRITYVGRLEPAKKVDQLIHGFHLSGLHREGYVLTIVGHGTMKSNLRELARELKLENHCDFTGRIYEPDDLAKIYAETVCSASPGYAGLSLTQSIGFGVPVVVSRDEPHSPEIELVTTGGVLWHRTDDLASITSTLLQAIHPVEARRREAWSATVRNLYSAEAMAKGIRDALLGDAPDFNKGERHESCR